MSIQINDNELQIRSKAPLWMPHQWEAFNGDTFIQAQFQKLQKEFNIVNAVETGTCFGSSTIWMASNFAKVYTCESNQNFYEIASARFKNYGISTIVNGLIDSYVFLKYHIPQNCGNTIFFLDAHESGKYLPLILELEAIAKLDIDKKIIAIHDCKVPNEPNLGYDSYEGSDICYEFIKEKLDAIYTDGYEYYYNSDETSTEIKRGIIYIKPKF